MLKNILLLITIILFLFGAYSSFFNKDNYVEYYPNGKKKFEFTTVSANNDNLCIKEYFENGNLKKIFYTINDKIEGEYLENYEEGNTLCRLSLVNGKKQGKGLYYHKNGNLSDINYFKNDLKHGEQRHFNENGDLWLINLKSNDISYFIKQFYFKTDGSLEEIIEEYIPKVDIKSDTLLSIGDTLKYQFQLPLPDSIIHSKSLYFFYDLLLDNGSEDYLTKYPISNYAILDSLPKNKGMILHEKGEYIFYVLIGNKDNTDTFFYDPPFVQRIVVE